MRLINTATHEFEEFSDHQRPKYAILSHTWGEDEISYRDFMYLQSQSSGNEFKTKVLEALLPKVPRRDSQGYMKIRSLCEVARARGHQWVWIDTCCIDKTSSAEISGAINSMWDWYASAEECYVHLVDVPECTGGFKSHLGKWPSGKRIRDETLRSMEKSRWFTRGWTLQELLAPTRLNYYDTNWNMIASRNYLANTVSAITGIPAIYLIDRNHLAEASIAMKMSWMAHRQTTLIEDMGYALIGLFGVSMPLVYGEGRKAFMRLQMEILSRSHDDSIFAWSASIEPSGLLSRWPTAFKDSGNIIPCLENQSIPRLPFLMTNMGMQVQIPKLQRDTVASKLMNSGRIIVQTFMDNHQTEVDLPLACGRVQDITQPISRSSREEAYKNSLSVKLGRAGPRFRRRDCCNLPAADGSLRAEGFSLSGYTVYYVEQPGL